MDQASGSNHARFNPSMARMGMPPNYQRPQQPAMCEQIGRSVAGPAYDTNNAAYYPLMGQSMNNMEISSQPRHQVQQAQQAQQAQQVFRENQPMQTCNNVNNRSLAAEYTPENRESFMMSSLDDLDFDILDLPSDNIDQNNDAAVNPSYDMESTLINQQSIAQNQTKPSVAAHPIINPNYEKTIQELLLDEYNKSGFPPIDPEHAMETAKLLNPQRSFLLNIGSRADFNLTVPVDDSQVPTTLLNSILPESDSSLDSELEDFYNQSQTLADPKLNQVYNQSNSSDVPKVLNNYDQSNTSAQQNHNPVNTSADPNLKQFYNLTNISTNPKLKQLYSENNPSDNPILKQFYNQNEPPVDPGAKHVYNQNELAASSSQSGPPVKSSLKQNEPSGNTTSIPHNLPFQRGVNNGFTYVKDQRPKNSNPEPKNQPLSQQPLPNFWCSVSYFELDVKVGDTFTTKSCYPSLTVDGFVDPSGGNRFCLGALSNVLRTHASDKARVHIGKGITLDRSGEGDVYLRNESSHSVFLQSYYLDHLNSRHHNTITSEVLVHKIHPSANVKVFDLRHCCDQMRQKVANNQRTNFKRAVTVGGRKINVNQNNKNLDAAMGVSVDQLRAYCCLRMSFVKGWGPDYPRANIKETPCWIEVQLHRALQVLDEILKPLATAPCSDR